MKLTLTGAGRYVVSVNGVDLEGAHNTEREAIERAANLELSDPSAVVEYRNELRVRVEAAGAATAPPPVVVPPPPAPITGLLWSWPATAVAPFGIHAKPAAEWGADPRVTLVNVGGRPGVRLLTVPGDDHINGSNDSERCDLRLGTAESDAQEGRKWRTRFSIWLPDDFAELPASPLNAQPWYWHALLDWHDDADTPGSQGPVQLIVYPPTAASPDRATGMVMQIFGGAWKQGEKPSGEFRIGPVVRNKWLDFDLDIHWTSTASGFCNGWLNGAQFMAYNGPTLLAGNGAYLKLANYHTAHGKRSAVVHGRADRRVL